MIPIRDRLENHVEVATGKWDLPRRFRGTLRLHGVTVWECGCLHLDITGALKCIWDARKLIEERAAA